MSHEKFYVWPRPKKLRPLSDEFEMRQHDKFYFVVQKIMYKKEKNYVECKTVMNLSKLITVFVLIILIYLLNLLELFCIE